MLLMSMLYVSKETIAERCSIDEPGDRFYRYIKVILAANDLIPAAINVTYKRIEGRVWSPHAA